MSDLIQAQINAMKTMAGTTLIAMDALPLKGKRVLLREDLNSPIDNGALLDDTRLQAIVPTVKYALAQGAALMILAHQGRPKEGISDPAFSLELIAKRLSSLLERPVPLVTDWLAHPPVVSPGEVVLLENVRFLVGENANDPALAKTMAALCDIFVMDAFGCSHRAQVSTEGIIHHAPIAAAGPLLVKECEALTRALKTPKKPLLAIIGGSKISTKIGVLEALIAQVDHLIVGGGMANTFLKAQGIGVGTSLVEDDCLDQALGVLAVAKAKGVGVHLPIDVIVAEDINAKAGRISALDSIRGSEAIFDCGPASNARFRELILSAGTVIWNGPVGVFEKPAFMAGTRALIEAISVSSAYTLAGGGDTLAALSLVAPTHEGFDDISTGGGAFLEYVEGKTLPALAALEARAKAVMKTR